MRFLRSFFLTVVILYFSAPKIAYADFWGGDLPLLTEIVANTLQQISQLSSILGTGKDTLQLLEDINRGVRDAMDLSRTMNRTLQPGVLSDLQSATQLLQTLQGLYGKIPDSASAPLQGTLDASAAESIHLHNEAFRYADAVDPEAERIKEYSRNVNPLGAQKLTAQAVGVLIHVSNQILRTNAALLKVQSENLALQNRKDKLDSEQNRVRYAELSAAMGTLAPSYRLAPLGR